MLKKLPVWFVVALALLAGHSLLAQHTVENAFPAIQLPSPIEMLSPPDGTDRIFVVSQSGIIYLFPNQQQVSSATTFLNIASKIEGGGERGLLGLAFHPDFRTNGYFYVNYTRNSNGLQTVIARYQVNAANPNQADPASELILLTFSQPFTNHNGGKLVFGNDGYLYIASGDGGNGGDPQNNGQSLTTLLGKILRIDVDNPSNGLPYGIPADNPFSQQTDGTRKEIFAYGLRNPWKIAVDKATGRIWAGDVGQNAREEVDTITNGGNYGWRFKEGKACYNPGSNCNTVPSIDPVWDYEHASGAGRSITGGFVYRGKALSSLIGKYIYGDYVSRNVWSLEVPAAGNPVNQLLLNVPFNISAFGEDAQGELYVLNHGGGTIWRIINPQLEPALAQVNPSSGAVGANVVLTGSRFSLVPGENQVRFGNTAAVVTSATEAMLTVTVPPLPLGAQQISVRVHGRLAPSTVAFTITKASQTINFAALPNRLLDTKFRLSATATSGLPVVFSLVSGPALLSNDSLTLLDEGLVTIRATQPGDTTYDAAPAVERAFRSIKSTQTITFEPLPDREAGSKFALTASASSGLPVSFSVVSGPALLSNDSLTLTGVGVVTVRASQAGDAKIDPAPPVERSFQALRLSQTIHFSPIANKLVGDPDFRLNVFASSNMPVQLEVVQGPVQLRGDTVRITGVGAASIRASQAGSVLFAPANSVTRSFTIEAITGTPMSNQPEWEVFPNPADEFLTVRLGGLPSMRAGQVTLLDCLGRVVLIQPISITTDQPETQLEVSALSPGLYLLHIRSGTIEYRQKLVLR